MWYNWSIKCPMRKRDIRATQHKMVANNAGWNVCNRKPWLLPGGMATHLPIFSPSASCKTSTYDIILCTVHPCKPQNAPLNHQTWTLAGDQNGWFVMNVSQFCDDQLVYDFFWYCDDQLVYDFFWYCDDQLVYDFFPILWWSTCVWFFF